MVRRLKIYLKYFKTDDSASKVIFLIKALNKHSGGFGDAFNYEGCWNFRKITLQYYYQQFVMRDNSFLNVKYT